MIERTWIRLVCTKCWKVFWRFDNEHTICLLCRAAAERKAKGLPPIVDPI